MISSQICNRQAQDNRISTQASQNQQPPIKVISDSAYIHQNFDVDSFKSKYIFKPFEYQEKLQQTLTHSLGACNFKSIHQQETYPEDHSHQNSFIVEQFTHNHNNNSRTSNPKFGLFSNTQSFNSTSKSIETNKSILYDNHTTKNHSKFTQKSNFNSNDASQILKRSSISKPPDLLMKKAISLTTNFKNKQITQESQETDNMLQSVVQSPHERTLKKKTLFNKEKYEQEQKNKGFTYDKQKVSSVKTSEKNIQNLSTPMKNCLMEKMQVGLSLCQSIALGGQTVQNLFKSTSDNGFMNSQQLTNLSQLLMQKIISQMPEPMNFYQFCMLLFPQTSKSMPCSVFVMDTLFYVNTPESKDIIYVFKDKKRNLLSKMKNKNKSAYELFMKRRVHYENSRLKEQKLRRTGCFDEREKGHENMLNGGKQSWMVGKEKFTTMSSLVKNKFRDGKSKAYEASVKCLQDSYYMNDQRYSIIEEQQGAGSKEVLDFSRKTTRFEEFDVQKEESSRIQEESSLRQGQKSYKQRESYRSENSQVIDQVLTQKELTKMTSKFSILSTFKTFITQNQLKDSQRISPQKQITLKYNEGYLSPDESRLITPSNSVRQSIHTLQTEYMALLKYNNNQIMRLKAPEFKAIFYNPLYANEKFKNNNNTQYIQALPIEDQFKDLKVYSLHFHYQLFKDEELFVYVRNSLYKENQYMAGGGRTNMQEENCSFLGNQNSQGNNFSHTNNFSHGNSFSHASNFLYGKNCKHTSSKQSSHKSNSLFECMSPQKKRNLLLKKQLKQQSIEVYLYFQIFEMYTYISMHYNKQILNGIFRFIEYDNDFALFETQNILAKDLSKSGQFIKAKIFVDQNQDNHNPSNPVHQANHSNQTNQQQTQMLEELLLKMKKTQSSNSSATNTSSDTTENFSSTQTPSQTMKKIAKEIQKLSIDSNNQEPTILQKELISYFSQQNTKIQQEMSNYFIDKIEKIKNVKDFNLSKSIFKVINGLSATKNGENSSNPREGIKNALNDGDKVQGRYQKLRFNQCFSNAQTKCDQSTDFHQILNDDKKLEKFLKEKEQNDPYARKSISNYSIVRWKNEVQNAKERKSNNNQNGHHQSKTLQIESHFDGVRQPKKQRRPMTAQSGKHRQQRCHQRIIFEKLTTTMAFSWNVANNIQKGISTNNLIGDSVKSDINKRSYRHTRNNREESKENNPFIIDSNSKFNQRSNSLSNTQLGQFNGFSKNQNNVILSKQTRESKKFEKKMINQKYTQWNKAKFKLNGFKTDKFF